MCNNTLRWMEIGLGLILNKKRELNLKRLPIQLGVFTTKIIHLQSCILYG